VVVRGGAVVADVGAGHHHHLTGVRGVREDLLIAAHGRVEHPLTDGDTGGANRASLEHLPVGGDCDGAGHAPSLSVFVLMVVSASKVTVPWWIVASTRPCRRLPSHGEFADFDRKSAPTAHTRSGWNTARLAGSPTAGHLP